MQEQKVLSFYKFVMIQNPHELREDLLAKANQLELKGTIILAEEGINGMISGSGENIKLIVEYISLHTEIGEFELKYSTHNDEVFRRMLVKVKKEIITMRKEVDPSKKTGKYLSPKDLQKMLDSKEDLILLDTRNDYEYELGSFKNAINPNIKSFGEFVHYIDSNKKSLVNKKVVTFCTGGIRCEKATAYMQKKGILDVYQLKGGIIQYFEKTHFDGGSKHWQGDCVVFDKRKAITPELKSSSKHICYICLKEMTTNTISPEEGAGGEICLTCSNSIKVNRQKRIEIRKEKKERELSEFKN